MVNMNENEYEEDLEEVTDEEDTDIEEPELVDVEEANGKKLKDLREKIARLDTEKKQLLDETQRARAEFLNARKRLEEERAKDKQRFIRKHAEELLPLCDSFQMAMSNTEVWEKADKSWRTGIEGIHMQLLNVLDSYGVTPLHPLGEAFDPYKHEAVGTEEVEDEALQDTIVSVVQRGYEMTHNGTTEIIRPARVTTGILKS